MGINFPASPTIDQLYPQPPLAGVPVYRWDGQKWTTQGATAIKVPVYTDGSTPMIAQLKLFGSPPAAANDAAPKSYVDGCVRYDSAQTLSSSQTLQARSNVYAASVDALAFSGLQVNGAFDVAQEFGTAVQQIAPGNIKYIGDVHLVTHGNASSSGALNAAITDPSGALPGFTGCLSLWPAANWTTVSPNDNACVVQYIEHIRACRLKLGTVNAMPVTISFWIYSDLAGSASLSMRNGPTSNRSYVVELPLAGGVWEYKSITIPGDTQGAWSTALNAASVIITFGFALGSNFKTTVVNAWQSGSYMAGPAQTNLLSTLNNAVRITGLTVIPGNQGPSAERSASIQRNYHDELRATQRYLSLRYYPNNQSFIGFKCPGGAFQEVYSLPVPMRTAPTCSVPNQAGWVYVNGAAAAVSLTGPISGLPVSEREVMFASGGNVDADSVPRYYRNQGGGASVLHSARF